MANKNIFALGFFFIIVPLFFILLTTQGKDEDRSPFKRDIDQNILCLNPDTEFGIVLDSFQMHTGRIRWNQNLADILRRHNLGMHTVHDITREVDKIFDVTKFKAGNTYHFYFNKQDSTHEVNYFVYEHTPKEYVKVSLGESINVEKAVKESRLVKKTSVGTIETSLWGTMEKNDVHPTLALRLSEIYAWSINFFNLKPGDQFKVIYEEEFVDSSSIGINEIQTARFVHEGEEFYAIPFVQDSSRDFYDLEGNSLRREFLKAPLKFSRISSGYSLSRMHPILNYRRPHRGVDYAAPKGTPVHAIGEGIVVDKGYTKGAGYYLKIRHNSIDITGYNHLSGYARGISKGVKVKQGETIGYVGTTGYATGPHLDFRFWKNGRPVNPLQVEAPPVEPIEEVNRDSFQKVKEACLKKLG
ncbi:MAG: peptidoglycan DD-metalloendopeptidase family protein [Bacteroidales bacterium]|nr:peptidoglycan DD-metalloendopeptidase family protein [Bacteroidales bacterium]